MNRPTSAALPVLLAAAVLAVPSAKGEPGKPPEKAATPIPAVYRETLPNGIRLVLSPDPTAAFVAWKLAYETTWRDEPPGKAGIRFLALMTVMHADPAWKSRIERAGGWWDPTNLYPEVSAQDFTLHAQETESAVGILREMIASASRSDDPALKQGFEQAKERILGYSAPNVDRDLLAQAAFDDPFAKSSRQAVKEEAATITEHELRAFRAANFAPQRAVVTAAGAIDGPGTLALLRAELGKIPASKEATKPARFGAFVPGRKLTVPSQQPFLRVAWPIPGDVASIEAAVLAVALDARLKKAGLEEIGVRADVWEGTRLFRIGIGGKEAEALGEVEKRVAGLGDLTEEESQAARRRVGGSTLERFANSYWVSWPLAFPFEPLGGNPWEEFRRLRATDAKRLAAVAKLIFDPARRSMVVGAGTEAKEPTLSGGGMPVEVSAHPPPSSIPLPAAAPVEAKRLAGGAVLASTDAHALVWTLGGRFPLGAVDGGMVDYVTKLKQTVPERWKEMGKLEVRRSRLSLRLRSIGSKEELDTCWKEIDGWLSAAASVQPKAAWTWTVGGPEIPSFTTAPGGIAAAGGPPPSGERMHERRGIRIPLDGLREPEGLAAAFFLSDWLAARSREKGRYGPFTLDLPPLPHAFARVDLEWRGDAGEIVVDTAEASSDALPAARDWLKGGAGLDKVEPDPFENLRGHALGSAGGMLPDGGDHAPFRAALAGEHGVRGGFPEAARAAAKTLTPEALRARTKGWLAKAELESPPEQK